MGQFLQVNGDYNIKTAEGGNIKFDTGPGVGEVPYLLWQESDDSWNFKTGAG